MSSPWHLLRREIGRFRLHPLVREGMVGGILGILGGWVAAWAMLWIT